MFLIKRFFDFISEKDKEILKHNFKRALLKPKHHEFRFSSILRILYNVRNRAVHGEDFWTFSLMEKEQKKNFIKDGYTSFAVISDGYLGYRLKKRNEKLSISLTYEELRDIFIRTAISNIKNYF